MKKFIWMASYPKSGNTWFRAFLANLISNSDKPVNINKLSFGSNEGKNAPDEEVCEVDSGGIASARGPLDTALGYDSADLPLDQVDRLRRELYLYRAKDEKPMFVKVHDAAFRLDDGQLLFPAEATKAVLYFIRNPLDVCVSFAHHSGKSDCRRSLLAMGRKNLAVCGNPRRHHDQLRQRMGTWSDHVKSWTDNKEYPLHVVRYEDMKLKTEETFTAAAQFAGLPADKERIDRAIHFSKFEELSKQEQAEGFRERLHADRKFFRKGEIGSWRESLNSEQAERIVREHSEVMKRFGYLSENGDLLC